MTLPNDVAPPSAVVILTSADVTLDTNGRDCPFKNVIVEMFDTKVRSHARAETDWMFCLGVLESPRLQATGFPALPGRKSNQFLYGRDFLILFQHYNYENKHIFDFKIGLFLVFMGQLSPTNPPIFIHTVRLAVVRAVRPLDYITERSNAEK